MKSILTASRRNNASDAITGLLMFNGKRFMQVLEGPPEAVQATFARICGDRRHRAPVLLSQTAVSHREFGDWSMGYRAVEGTAHDQLVEAMSTKASNANPSLKAQLLHFARGLAN